MSQGKDVRQAFGLAQFVPQLTYDIIARFIPGILLLGLVCLDWNDELKYLIPWAADGRLWEWSRLPGIILLSYFMSQIFETFWYLKFDKMLQKEHEEAEEEVRKESLSGIVVADPGFPSEDYNFPSLSLIYDAIRLKNPVAGARIVKIRAEVQLYRTMFLGVLVLSVTQLVYFAYTKNWADLTISFGLIILMVMLFVQAKHRRKRLVWALYNHWLLLLDKRGTKTLGSVY